MSKISIVMSVYNGADYLRESIDSILDQTHSDFEFIIVNDGSTDNTQNIIELYNDNRIKLFNISNVGLPSALNLGISHAKSNIIARMDADDVAHKTRLEKQLNYLEDHEECILLGTNARVIDENGIFIYKENVITNWDVIKQKFPRSSFIHPSVMFKKEVFDMVGGYSTFMKRAQDAVLFSKMKEYGSMTNLSETLLDYRITTSSLSVRNKSDKCFIDKLVDMASKGIKPLPKDLVKLDEIIAQKGTIDRVWFYHVFLVKKYLWNNFNRKLALVNLFKAIRINFFSQELLVLALISLLPAKIIKFLYSKVKSE